MHSKKEFAQAYNDYYQPILNFLRSRVRDGQVAEDLAGEVFYKAWKGRHNFRFGTSYKAWLFRIARNTLIDYWRKKKDMTLGNLEEGQIMSPGPTLEASMQVQDEVGVLTAALDQLPGTMKSVTILRFIEGLSAKEVAAILNLTEGNVRTIQFRALAKLREYMNHE